MYHDLDGRDYQDLYNEVMKIKKLFGVKGGLSMKHYIVNLKEWVKANKKKTIAIGSTVGAAIVLIAGTITFTALNAKGGLEVVSSSGTDLVSETVSVSSTTSTAIPESTETIQNEDGTTTVVEQYADGTVKEVITNKDGTTTETITKPNGEKQTSTKPSGGNTSSSKPSGGSSSSSKPSGGNTSSSKPSGGGSSSSKPSGGNTSSSKPSGGGSSSSKPSGGNTSSSKPPVESEPGTIPVEPAKRVWRYTEAEIQQMIQSGIQYGQSIGMTYWAEMNVDNSSWTQPWDEFSSMTPLEFISTRLSRYKSEGTTDFGLAYAWDTSNGVGVWEVYVLF